MLMRFKALCMIMLFVVVLSPLHVNAFSPQFNPMYRGVYVEFSDCEEGSFSYAHNYFIDVVVYSEEADERMIETGNGWEVPSALDASEYGNFDNQWISLSKFLEFGPAFRDNCSVNFFGDLDTLLGFPFTMYKVVVYLDDEMIAESQMYNMSDVSYSDHLGEMVIFNTTNNSFNIDYMYENPDSYEPIRFHAIIFGFLFYMLLIVYIFGEPIVYFCYPTVRWKVWPVLAINLVIIPFIYLLRFLDLDRVWTSVMFGLLLGIIALVKMKVLDRMEFELTKDSKLIVIVFTLVSWGCLFIMAI